MNRLIEHLKYEDSLTLDALRQLYRTLALKCHPDVTKESGNTFVQLQLEYEDAVRQILNRQGTHRKAIVRRMGAGGDPRSAFLRTLYLYAIVHDRSHWKDIDRALFASAEAYGGSAEAVIRQYRKAFVDKPGSWRGTGPAATAHERLLLAIRQLGCYYENDIYPNKRLLLSYIGELAALSEKLDAEKRSCVLAFGQYLKEEAHGERVPLMMIWDRGT